MGVMLLRHRYEQLRKIITGPHESISSDDMDRQTMALVVFVGVILFLIGQFA